MFRFLRLFTLAVFTLRASTGCFYAAASTKPAGPAAPDVAEVDGGQLNFGFNAALLNALAGGGVVVTWHGSLMETTVGTVSTGRAYSVSGGLVDSLTGRGEFETKGNIELSGPGGDIELRHMTLDTTGSQAVVTAEVLWNGACSGRIPIFTVLPDDNFILPWKGSAYTSDVVPIAVNVSFASFFNTLMSPARPLLTNGLNSGYISVSVMINPATVA